MFVVRFSKKLSLLAREIYLAADRVLKDSYVCVFNLSIIVFCRHCPDRDIIFIENKMHLLQSPVRDEI